MFIIGADIGQAANPTALAVLETAPGDDQVRHLERLPLGTPYPAVARRIGRLTMALPDPALVVDATGVGRPVVDQLRDAGLDPIAVTITAGKEVAFEDGAWRVPKKELVRSLAVALECGRLRVASRIPDAAVLVRELAAFTATIGDCGHTRFAGQGERDDLVVAVALAVWWADAADGRNPAGIRGAARQRAGHGTGGRCPSSHRTATSWC